MPAESGSKHRMAPGRKAYVQVARGRITANGEVLDQGDALMLEDERAVTLSEGQGAEVLVFDLGEADMPAREL